MKAKFQAIYLPALAQFVGKNDVRFYLNGFLIEPAPAEVGGVYLVATDGHTATVIHDPKGESDGIYIMPVPTRLLTCCKPYKKQSDIIFGDKMLSFDGFMATLSDVTGHLESVRCKPIDGKYPDWRRITPDLSVQRQPTDSMSAPAQSVFINPAYIARCNAALAGMGIKPNRRPSIEFFTQARSSGELAVSPYTLDNHRMIFIIMPMRDDSSKDRHNWMADLDKRWTPINEQNAGEGK